MAGNSRTPGSPADWVQRGGDAFGMTDLVVSLTLGALTGSQLINVTRRDADQLGSGSR